MTENVECSQHGSEPASQQPTPSASAKPAEAVLAHAQGGDDRQEPQSHEYLPCEQLPAFEPPGDDDAVVWRYMTFTKLVSMLHTQALYFTRLDRFEDEFEGTLPQRTYEALSPQLRECFDLERKNALASCWSLGDHESAALWKIFVNGNEGVAVKFTFGHLCTSFIRSGLYSDSSISAGVVST